MGDLLSMLWAVGSEGKAELAVVVNQLGGGLRDGLWVGRGGGVVGAVAVSGQLAQVVCPVAVDHAVQELARLAGVKEGPALYAGARGVAGRRL